ncbi:MAG: hypothetical protein Q4B73_00080 [Lachnospiraceae bacterium]|nr:hypothetical protein [Lachnospiraceae bacterium]
MKTWKGFVQYSSDSRAPIYKKIEFAIDDEMYKKITDAVNSGKELERCEFINDLYRIFDAAARDEESVLNNAQDADDGTDKSHRYFLDEAFIEDPGDIIRFEAHIKGLVVPWEWRDSSNLLNLVIEDDYNGITRGNISLRYDDAGTVAGLEHFSYKGLQSRDINSEDWADAFPYYESLYDDIVETLVRLKNENRRA